MAIRPKLLTLDCTNTLFKLKSTSGTIYAAVADSHGIKVDSTKLDSAFLKNYKEQSQSYSNFGCMSGISTKVWWTDLVKKTFLDSGVPKSPALDTVAKQLFEEFNGGKHWEVYPQTKEALEAIRDKGVKLGVISNFDERLPKVLSELDLCHLFDFVLTSVDAQVAKPDCQIFQLALQLAGNVQPSHAVHLGDNLRLDVEPALRVGMHAIWINRNNVDVPPELLECDKFHAVSNIEEVVKCIKKSSS
ncbi:haloacid dehalogenase-like hydrolase domain-containing protein 3 [Branchiostoma floridae]|uniref:Haloacid dehalogenase-like hydrolase domain-containing protein 3 n=1 Tax=Branchiostoma floridae TaxID=7739 RepID=A0A9J7L648_BRAFL|nr:haloacid dehalogenase-like hydrolase domain-containing protein 3 [Branchiostoma floridae]